LRQGAAVHVSAVQCEAPAQPSAQATLDLRSQLDEQVQPMNA